MRKINKYVGCFLVWIVSILLIMLMFMQLSCKGLKIKNEQTIEIKDG